MKIIISIVLVAALAITISEALNHKGILGLYVPKNFKCEGSITLYLIDVNKKCTTLTPDVLVTQDKSNGIVSDSGLYIELSFTVNLGATYNIYDMESIDVLFVPKDEKKCENIQLRTVSLKSSQIFINKKNEKLESEKVIDLEIKDSPTLLPSISNKNFPHEIKLEFSAPNNVDCAALITLEGMVKPVQRVMTETLNIRFHSETQEEVKDVNYTPIIMYGMDSLKIGFEPKKLRNTNFDQIYLDTAYITFTNVFHFGKGTCAQKLIPNTKLHLVKK